jgi:hypothetical protein
MMESAATATEATTQALRVGLIWQHLRNNNTSYLLAVLLAHAMGLLEPVVTYGQGICS